MKIVLLSDHETHGGAAQATCRLAQALAEHDEVTRVVLHPEGGPHPWRTVPLVREESELRRQLLRVPRKAWPSQFPRPATFAFYAGELERTLRHLHPDAINIHNLHGGTTWGWSPELAAVAARVAPVVWTLHDMWSFTGRCAYSYDCQRFRTGCDASCPTPHEPPVLPPEEIAGALELRRELFRSTPLNAVAPSRWLAREAQRGLWAGRRVEVIPYGVPTQTFVPRPRAEARQALGIAARGPVFLAAAVDFSERRKGAQFLPAALDQGRPLTLLTMGHGATTGLPASVEVRALGWVDSDDQKAQMYSAADALLHPAPVDNFPNVILEALACGTPVIGANVGGVPELVRSRTTGWLAAEATGQALAATVRAALADLEAGLDLRAGCRRVAESEYPLELQAARYRRVFEDLRLSRAA